MLITLRSRAQGRLLKVGCLPYLLLLTLVTLNNKRFLSLTVFVIQKFVLASGFWLPCFCDFLARYQLGLQSSEGFTGAHGFTSDVVHSPAGVSCWLSESGSAPLQVAFSTGLLECPCNMASPERAVQETQP